MQLTDNRFAKMIASRRWIRRMNLFELPKQVSVSSGEFKIYLSAQDWRGPSYHALKWGLETYESENITFLKQHLLQHSDPVFLDVGANVGIFSFLLSTQMKSLTVHAFEPEKVSYACLEKTFSQPCFSKVSVHNVALSDSIEEKLFFGDEQNHGGHSLHKESILLEKNPIAESYHVQTNTLDCFVEQNSLNKVDVIKIDVQGHEPNFLKGAEKTLSDWRPTVLMECYFRELLKPKSELVKPFVNNNYYAYIPKTQSVIELNQQALEPLTNEFSDYVDIAFIPCEKKTL